VVTDVETVAVSLHFDPRSMSRGWPYFELHKAYQGKIQILGHVDAGIKPTTARLWERIESLLKGFSLNDLWRLKKDFPLSIPGYAAAIDGLVILRTQILNANQPTRICESDLSFSTEKLELLRNLLKSCKQMKISNLKSAHGFVGPLLSCDDASVRHMEVLSSIYGIVAYDARLVFEEVERAPLEAFVHQIVKPNLDYIAVIDLCHCSFTNGSDGERVKLMAAEPTKPNPIQL
jgi:hypothetical protein